MPPGRPIDRVPITPSRGEPAPPPKDPGILAAIGAQSRVATDEWKENVRFKRYEAYSSLADSLGDLGVTRESLAPDRQYVLGMPIPAGNSLDYNKVWAAAQRLRGEGRFTELPPTMEEYEHRALGRAGARARDKQTVAAAGVHGRWLPQLVGGGLADMADSDLGPAQFMIGPSGTILRQALGNGLLGLGEEALKTPERVAGRKAFGETMSQEEILINLVGSAIAPAGLTVAGHGVVKLGGAGADLSRAGFERVVVANWDRLPAGVRARWTAATKLPEAEIPDDLLADLSESIIGRENMADFERGAVDLVRREAAVTASNPFVPNGAGLATHQDMLGAAMARIMAEHPAAPRGPVRVPEAPPARSAGGGTVAPLGPSIEAVARQAVPALTMTSGKRSVADNKRVRGDPDSYHLSDNARDFTPPPGMSMEQLHSKLKPLYPGYDVINEGDHVHIEPGPGMLRGGTAISTGVVAGEARAIVKRRIGIAENASGDPNARPRDKHGRLLSNALGPYQFMPETWNSLYIRRFGTGGLTPDQIAAKRTDPRINEVLMDDLLAANETSLRKADIPISSGNLYLAHFAGPGGAKKLHAAARRASAESVLGADVVRANPFLRGMTAGDVIAWAERKMGGSGSGARGGTGLELSPDVPDPTGALRAEIDRLNAESARIEADLAAQRGDPGDAINAALIDGALDAPVRPFETDTLGPPQGERGLAELPPLERRASDVDAAPAEVLALLPELRSRLDPAQRGLVDVAGLARELGANEADLRRGLNALVSEGRITTRRKDGAFLFKPKLPARELSLLEWIARRGGIEDRGGDIASMGGERWHLRDAPSYAKPKQGKRGRKLTAVPGRGKLIKPHAGEQAGMFGAGGTRANDPESLFQAAIDDGYFPDLVAHSEMAASGAADNYLPDIGIFMAAISDELGGVKRYSFDGRKGATQFSQADRSDPFWQEERPALGRDSPDPEVRAAAQDMEDDAVDIYGLERGAVDPEVLDWAAQLDLAQRRITGRMMEPGDALAKAWNDIAEMNAREAFDDADGLRYEDVDYDWQPKTFGPNSGLAGEDFAATGDRGGPAGAPEDAGARGLAGGDGAADAGSRGASLAAEAAVAPVTQGRIAALADPDSPEARAALDGMLHDLRMVAEADPAASLRLSEEGEVRSVADLMAEFDLTRTEIDAIKGCLI